MYPLYVGAGWAVPQQTQEKDFKAMRKSVNVFAPLRIWCNWLWRAHAHREGAKNGGARSKASALLPHQSSPLHFVFYQSVETVWQIPVMGSGAFFSSVVEPHMGPGGSTEHRAVGKSTDPQKVKTTSATSSKGPKESWEIDALKKRLLESFACDVASSPEETLRNSPWGWPLKSRKVEFAFAYFFSHHVFLVWI